MATILAYLRLVLFLGGVLVGLQVPGFVDQYGKSLEAHFSESQINLMKFQQDADRFFNGDMKKLIAHYKSDSDPVFQEGGRSISAIYERKVKLGKAVSDFRRSAFRAYRQVFLSPVSDIREEVWNSYTYSIKLDVSAISVGLLAGLVLSVLVEFLMRGLIGLVSLVINRPAYYIKPKSIKS